MRKLKIDDKVFCPECLYPFLRIRLPVYGVGKRTFLLHPQYTMLVPYSAVSSSCSRSGESTAFSNNYIRINEDGRGRAFLRMQGPANQFEHGCETPRTWHVLPCMLRVSITCKLHKTEEILPLARFIHFVGHL